VGWLRRDGDFSSNATAQLFSWSKAPGFKQRDQIQQVKLLGLSEKHEPVTLIDGEIGGNWLLNIRAQPEGYFSKGKVEFNKWNLVESERVNSQSNHKALCENFSHGVLGPEWIQRPVLVLPSKAYTEILFTKSTKLNFVKKAVGDPKSKESAYSNLIGRLVRIKDEKCYISPERTLVEHVLVANETSNDDRSGIKAGEERSETWKRRSYIGQNEISVMIAKVLNDTKASESIVIPHPGNSRETSWLHGVLDDMRASLENQ
jgi:hypothetical protein